jgi:hypothetical protein
VGRARLRVGRNRSFWLTRRDAGAHRGQIRAQFLTEAVVLSALGGIGGTLLGITATTGYAWSQNWPVVIPAAATLAGLGGAALIGAVAGAYPAMRAARLMPTEALNGTRPAMPRGIAHLGAPSARDRRGGSTVRLPGAMLIIWSYPCPELTAGSTSRVSVRARSPSDALMLASG